MKAENQLLVIGCGGHARFVLSLITNSEYEACGLIDLGERFNDTEVVMGVPVVGCLSSISQQYHLGRRKVVLAIGDNVFIAFCDV